MKLLCFIPLYLLAVLVSCKQDSGQSSNGSPWKRAAKSSEEESRPIFVRYYDEIDSGWLKKGSTPFPRFGPELARDGSDNQPPYRAFYNNGGRLISFVKYNGGEAAEYFVSYSYDSNFIYRLWHRDLSTVMEVFSITPDASQVCKVYYEEIH